MRCFAVSNTFPKKHIVTHCVAYVYGMMGQASLSQINDRLRELRPDVDEDFGGLHVILLRRNALQHAPCTF